MRALKSALLLSFGAAAVFSLAPARAEMVTADTLARSVRTALGDKRFSDAHVYALTGQALFATSPTERERFALYDAISLWRLTESPRALHLLDDLGHRPAVEPSLSARARFYSLWIRLELGERDALSGYSAQRLDGDLIARLVYYRAVIDGDENARPPSWRRSADLSRAVADFEQAPRVSPVWRGALSAALPGLGQASLGLWQEAAVSFGLNALCFGTAASFLRSGLVLPGVAAGTLGSFFYVSGILSTVRAADQINELEVAPAREKLQTVLLPELKWDF